MKTMPPDKNKNTQTHSLRTPALLALALVSIAIVYGAFAIVEWVWLQNADMEVVHLLHAVRGISAAVLLGVLVAWFLVRSGAPVFVPVSAGSQQRPFREDRLRQHAAWFVNLRWIAAAVSGALILIVHTSTHILPHETFLPLLGTVGSLAAANLVFDRLLRRSAVDYHRLIVRQVIVDLVILTILLHLSGGVENPLFILYSFHVIIASILLGRNEGYVFATVACGLFAAQAFGELSGVIPHYTIQLFPHGEHEAAGHVDSSVVIHAAHNTLYVMGRYLSFSAVLFGTAYFIGLIMDYVRRNEGDLEEMARTASAEHERLESVAHAVGAGLVLIDRQGIIRWFNRRIEDWFGWQADRIGRALEAESSPALREVFDEVERTGETQELEWAWEDRTFRVSISPIRDSEGDVVQQAALVQDVTTRKALEAQMMHTEKMASLGQMSAGIVHEIGNPLSSLSTRLKLMEGRKDNPEYIGQSVALLHGQIDRIQRIVRGVSQFSRVPKESWTACRVEEVLQEVIEILKMDRRAQGITIQAHIDDKLPETVGVRDQITQVFLNIGLNALEALDGNGTLSIRTDATIREIVIRFDDDGPGIAEEAVERLYEPFFTTKDQGSGLGLFICQNIVDAHGGRIDLSSEPGKGCSFAVHFPIRPRSVHIQDGGAA